MHKATPDLIRIYRRRRLVVIVANIATIFAAVALMMVVMNQFHANPLVAIPLCFGVLPLAWIGSMIFSFRYFRCPACGRSIPGVLTPRGVTFGRRCNHCDIDYAA